MFEIRELCDIINKDKPNIWDMCKNNGIIPEHARDLSEISLKERLAYEREVKFYFNGYKKVWKDII